MPKPKPTAKPGRSTPAPPARPVSVTTLVDPVLKKRWDDACRRIAAAAREESRDFDAKWEAVADIIEAQPPLYLAGGFSTDQDFFEKFLHVDRVTALRKARVARFASPAEIERLGDTRIDAVLDFLEAKAGKPLHGKLPVALEKVRVPASGKDKAATVLLTEATREQIRAATRALKGDQAARVKASPRGRALQTALSSAGLKQVSLGVHRDTVDLRGVPWDLLAKLGRVLTELELPASKPAPK